MKYIVKRSKTSGLGLYATVDIPKKQFIIEYIGKKIANENYDEYVEEHPNLYMFEVNEDWTIDGSNRKNTARYVNHSCNPNAGTNHNGGKIKFYSIKSIKAGEEITIDYGTDYFEEHIKPKGCKCDTCQK